MKGASLSHILWGLGGLQMFYQARKLTALRKSPSRPCRTLNISFCRTTSYVSIPLTLSNNSRASPEDAIGALYPAGLTLTTCRKPAEEGGGHLHAAWSRSIKQSQRWKRDIEGWERREAERAEVWYGRTGPWPPSSAGRLGPISVLGLVMPEY